MAVKGYLLELRNKHAKIDDRIRRELKNPLPDTLLISSLKKQKLNLKDKIAATKAA